MVQRDLGLHALVYTQGLALATSTSTHFLNVGRSRGRPRGISPPLRHPQFLIADEESIFGGNFLISLVSSLIALDDLFLRFILVSFNVVLKKK